jgi:thiol-disulfide isomerase/thioredoxin
MRQLPVLILLILSAGLASAQRGEMPEITLHPGDPAPDLYVSKWLGGEGVESFAKGTVYVVELWATWCGPCIQSMPHLSALNTEYRDKGVVFLGLNVDAESSQKDIPAFMTTMGEKMNFVVGLDTFEPAKLGAGPVSLISKNWLEASGQRGIPSTFVVGKEGRVVWMGHPAELDEPLKKIQADDWDVVAFKALRDKKTALNDRLQTAYRAKKWDAMITVFDELAVIQPEMKARFNISKVQILLRLKKDYDAAYALLRELMNGELAEDAQTLNEIAYTIASDEAITQRDDALVLEMALKADALTDHSNAPILDTLALAYLNAGQKEKAIETQTLAISKVDDDDKKLKKQLKKVLKKMQAEE